MGSVIQTAKSHLQKSHLNLTQASKISTDPNIISEFMNKIFTFYLTYIE